MALRLLYLIVLRVFDRIALLARVGVDARGRRGQALTPVSADATTTNVLVTLADDGRRSMTEFRAARSRAFPSL